MRRATERSPETVDSGMIVNDPDLTVSKICEYFNADEVEVVLRKLKFSIVHITFLLNNHYMTNIDYQRDPNEMHDDDQDMDEADVASSANMQQLVAAKAEELFRLCDIEEKGFIIKKDMQRLKDELGFAPEQLEDVFDSLDGDHNGYLTLEEFTSGFGMFLNIQMGDTEEQEIEHNPQEKEEQQLFHDTLDSLGAKGLYDDEETIQALWTKLRETDPTLLRQFEGFIGKVTTEIRRSKLDHRTIEAALQSKTSVHDTEVKRLYEEMEQQIKAEKAQVLAQEKLKERELREQMERELRAKEAQLMDVQKLQSDLEMKVFRLNMTESEIKNENERLQKEKFQLEGQLQEISKNLEESKNYISQLQNQTKKEKRDRAKQALNLTENIAIERESLVKQLDILKSVNKKLVDERDVIDAKVLYNHSIQESDPEEDDDVMAPLHDNDSESGVDISVRRPRRRVRRLIRNGSTDSGSEREYKVHRRYPRRRRNLRSGTSESEDMCDNVDRLLLSDFKKHRYKINYISNKDLLLLAQELGAREQPVGASAVLQHSELMTVAPNAVPDRMFKVAFIGDSGVGKTSFIQRFCTDNFRETFSATIGVDLQVKMLNLDQKIIALQLWDTAGQERFRSITTQYFRKSDGVVLVYDVTSETTFKNVRAWMTSIQEATEDDCVIALVGNKIDLCDDDEKRPVKYKDGAKLADEYGCLFFETSARQGTTIVETLEAIARLMQEKDDKQRKGENIIQITPKPKSKGCC
ncbi:unnamed protein product [Didymodactylos carnosus]|uniref:EF-hand domain-containing protein n=1 Tax=Didymodactylos carnosus TaxID=1234261 RepID=A0A814XQL4_9BILA|nr:unnamed protein product [Didymodactylos carnosus]CAF1219078.1 unnamed protein product [Didymodactylos carnosus]CAF3803832.1 unnamed protein product [Didymodactylos carnosus]CAF3982679.1 unnamed protein product [Didymodactylos carnosus]